MQSPNNFYYFFKYSVFTGPLEYQILKWYLEIASIIEGGLIQGAKQSPAPPWTPTQCYGHHCIACSHMIVLFYLQFYFFFFFFNQTSTCASDQWRVFFLKSCLYWHWEYQKINNTVKIYISNQHAHCKTFSYAIVIITIRSLFTKLSACWKVLEVVLLSLIQQNPSQANRTIHGRRE